eukprot:418672_1
MGNSSCMQKSTCKSKQTDVNLSTSHHDVDQFVIELNHYQQEHGIINNISQQKIISDQRRVVFVSALGLYQTYLFCPAPILYSAIFILPIKKKWIYCPEQCKNEINKSIIKTHTIFQNEAAWNNFTNLLKWKDRQNLMIWADNETFNDGETLVSEFWIQFSNKLITLYDPITKSRYNPIVLDRKWWQFDFDESKSKYKTNRYKILKELVFPTKEFKPMMEIIYQSNPSLHPVVSYQVAEQPVEFEFQPLKHTSAKPLVRTQKNGFVNAYKNQMDCEGIFCYMVLNNKALCADIIEQEGYTTEELVVENQGEWIISMDYNEYDIY